MYRAELAQVEPAKIVQRIPSGAEHKGTGSSPVRGVQKRSSTQHHEKYGAFVRRIVFSVARRLPKTFAQEDLVSAGWIGMSEALARRPDDLSEGQFEAYASYRIRGAILDYLRDLDPLSRRLRARARSIHRATQLLTDKNGGLPSSEELASHLGLSLSELQTAVSEIQSSVSERLGEEGGSELVSSEPSPEAQVSKRQRLRSIVCVIQRLSPRLQEVLRLYYDQERSLREIGELLGVTESRACQLHAEAVQKMRVLMNMRHQ